MNLVTNSYLLFTSFASEAAEKKGGIGALGVDGKALVLQIITFLIVFWLLKKFAFSKIITTLDERRNTIDQGVELGIQMAAEKEKLSQEIEKVLQKARVEADKIIAGGHQEASQLIKQTETDALKKTDALLADAKARIDDDIAKARKGLEKEMLSLVAEATEAIIGEKLDNTKDTMLIEKTLRGVKQA